MKLLNSVASILMCGEFLARLVHSYPRDVPQVLCSRMVPREKLSITRMCILATLPVSCTVYAVQLHYYYPQTESFLFAGL